MKQYLDLLDDILKTGYERQDRTETGAIGVFGRMLEFDMKIINLLYMNFSSSCRIYKIK